MMAIGCDRGAQLNPNGDRGQAGKKLAEPDKLIGSVLAVTIRASGQTYRIKQAGHMTARKLCQNQKSTLQHRGRPHMSPWLFRCTSKRRIITSLSPQNRRGLGMISTAGRTKNTPREGHILIIQCRRGLFHHRHTPENYCTSNCLYLVICDLQFYIFNF